MPTQRRGGKKEKRKYGEVEWKDIEQILLEAEIVARWAKNPFYIS